MPRFVWHLDFLHHADVEASRIWQRMRRMPGWFLDLNQAPSPMAA
jgi:hypothetical protein